MKKYAFILVSIVNMLFPQVVQCADSGIDGWEYVNLTYNFKCNPKWFIGDFFEHHNSQYRRFDSCFNRISIGCSPARWIKTAMGYDIMRVNHNWTHRLVPEVTGFFPIHNVRIAIRERYVYAWCPAMCQDSHELRSRIKAQFHIPQSRFSPYLASEFFITDVKWTKTRYYAGTGIRVDEHVDMECYYLYYVSKHSDSRHIVGIGINIKI